MKKMLILLGILLSAQSALANNKIQDADVKSATDIKSYILLTTGNLTASNPCISSLGSTSGLFIGAYVYDLTNPSYITIPTTITAIPGVCSAGQVQMSTNATHVATGDSIGFGGPLSLMVNTSKFWDDFNNQLFNTTISTLPTKVNPTVQKFLSGSGTYTRPTSPTPLYLRIIAVGGGAGGCGSSNGLDASSGTSGGATTFGPISAGGGGACQANGVNPVGGAGGSASLGAGPIGIAVAGGSGGGAGFNIPASGFGPAGGLGGSSALGGGGTSGYGSMGTSGAANTGAGGGGGGGTANQNNFITGAGGGSGGYVDAIINSPATTYSYAVGTGGTAGGAGSNGFNAGAGGSGVIIVEEHYQ